MRASSRSLPARADLVSWGFKAPVSMLLLPFFEQAWGSFRFLHVVRDGRDLAFSGNQTPVSKFYDATFPANGSGGRRRWEQKGMEAVKAIELWDRWNSDLFEWAGERRNGHSLDYLLLHTEDLLDPAAKFAAVKDVAEFVGSQLSDHDLCCIATETARDMGTHTKLDRKEKRTAVTNRFGKWRDKIEGKPDLGAALHATGARGLALFGYEPERALRGTAGEYVCDAPPANCPKPPPPARPATGPAGVRAPRLSAPKTVTDTDRCKGLKIGLDYKGADLYFQPATSYLECCDICRDVERCTHFTMDFRSGQCFLKEGTGTASRRTSLVSGYVVR
ncbi:unnamed protein product [Phaeothamnion confervicola]